VIIIFGSSGYIGKALVKKLRHLSIPYLESSRNSVDLKDVSSLLRWRSSNELSANSVPKLLVFLVSQSKNKPWDFADVKNSSEMLSSVSKVFPNIPLVFTSSVDVYGDSPILPINEKSEINPKSLYAISKVFSEQTILTDFKASQTSILRLPGVYGGVLSKSGVYNSFCQEIYETGYVTLHNKSVLELERDWISVHDLISYILRLASSFIPGTFNFTTGKSNTIAEWLNAFANMVGKPYSVKIDGSSNNFKYNHLIFDNTNFQSVGNFQFTDIGPSTPDIPTLSNSSDV